MARMTITVDEDLVERARAALCAPTKTEAIRRSLEETVRRRRLVEALSRKGMIELDLDQTGLERLRDQR